MESEIGGRRRSGSRAGAQELQGERGCLERSGDEPAADSENGKAQLAVGRKLGAGMRGGSGKPCRCRVSSGNISRSRRAIAAAKAAAQKAASLQQAAAQDLATQTDQDLLATVDSDISRAVPAAMEPLAQMMDEKQTDDNGTQ